MQWRECVKSADEERGSEEEKEEYWREDVRRRDEDSWREVKGVKEG